MKPSSKAAEGSGERNSTLSLSSLEMDSDDELLFEGQLNGTSVRVLVDSGASHIFTSKTTAIACGIIIHNDKSSLELGDRSTVSVEGKTRSILTLDALTSEEDIYLIPDIGESPERTVIVGRNWLRHHNPQVDWKSNCLHITKPDGRTFTVYPKHGGQSHERVQCKKIALKKFSMLVRKRKGELYVARMKPDIMVKATEEFKDITREYSDIFVDELPDQLPPNREVQFGIKLKSNEVPPVRPVIRLSSEELQELKRQLQMLLNKGTIRPSSSPYGAPVFFVKKKDNDLRMVCDYRALNKITIPDANPLPLISEALDQVAGATVFSQIDLIGAYHQMRIREEDCFKTAIRTRFGSFEWRLLCFGLTNAPAAFSRLMASLIRELNGECVVLCLDDVLVYSKSIREHKTHLRRLFDILRKHKLYAKRRKCSIGVSSVDFLGYKVSKEGAFMQERLIKAIVEWPKPSNIKDVQSLLGLANFYRRFIQGYAGIVRPMLDLVRYKSFQWLEEQEKSFTQLKQSLTSAPVLAHPKSDETLVVSTDASKYAVGATLEQCDHPIAFLSHRLSKTETDWDTGDQELLAFIIALREWGVYLRGRNFLLKTDHEPIRYLQTKARRTGRQARWLDQMQEHNYEVQHVAGHKNVAPDALRRRTDHNLSLNSISLSHNDISKRIQDGYEKDQWSRTMIKALQGHKDINKSNTPRQAINFKYDGTFIHWIGSNEARVFIPDVDTLRTEVVAEFHNANHLGTDKIYSAITRYAYWPRMYHTVKTFVAECIDCQRNKTPNMKAAGELQPLDIPTACWSEVSADFVTKFPKSRRGNDAVLVIVDRLSKSTIFIPTTETIDAKEVAFLFECNLFSKHGVPVTITSDRDPKFTSNVWRCLAQMSNVKLNMSTADHQQTDGQSENMIRTLSNMIISFIQKDPLNWEMALCQLEFEYNSSTHKSTGLAPFEVDLGRIPHRPYTRALAECSLHCKAAIDYSTCRKIFQRLAQDNIAQARADQKYYADKSRRQVRFQKGDWVMLRSEALDVYKRSTLPEKWRPKYLGSLEIKKVMGPVTYMIEMPPSMKKAHNVFHVAKLKPYVGSRKDDQDIDVMIDGDGTIEQVVSEILDKKRWNRQVQ